MVCKVQIFPSFFFGFRWEHFPFPSYKGFYWGLEKSLFAETALSEPLHKRWLSSLMHLLSEVNSTQIRGRTPWDQGRTLSPSPHHQGRVVPKPRWPVLGQERDIALRVPEARRGPFSSQLQGTTEEAILTF